MKKLILLSLIILASLLELKSQNIDIRTLIDGYEVTFTPEINFPNKGIIKYEWDFGDGKTAKGESPTHLYNAYNTYHVSLKVTYKTGVGVIDISGYLPYTEFDWVTIAPPDYIITETAGLNPTIALTQNSFSANVPFGVECYIDADFFNNNSDKNYTWELEINNQRNGNIEITSNERTKTFNITQNEGIYTIRFRVSNTYNPGVFAWSNSVTVQIGNSNSDPNCEQSPCFNSKIYSPTTIIEKGNDAEFYLSIFASNYQSSDAGTCWSFDQAYDEYEWQQIWTAIDESGNPFTLNTNDISFEINRHYAVKRIPKIKDLPVGKYTISCKVAPNRNCNKWVSYAYSNIEIKPSLILSNDIEDDLSGKSLSFKITGGTEIINISGTEITEGSILVYGDWINIDKFNSEELVVSCDANGTEDRHGRIIVNFPDTYESKTIYFHQSRSIYEVDDNRKLSEAMNNAEDGATIILDEGTYNVPINMIGKNITLASKFLTTNDPYYIDNTIIDANGEGSVINLIGNNELTGTTKISGLHLRGGDAEKGGGIYASHANLELEHVLIHGNTANTGGGIYSNNSNINANHVTLTGNNAATVYVEAGEIECRLGHMVYLKNASEIVFNNSIIGGSEGDTYFGGIYFDANSPKCTFRKIYTVVQGTSAWLISQNGTKRSGTVYIPNGNGSFDYEVDINSEKTIGYEDPSAQNYWLGANTSYLSRCDDGKEIGALFRPGSCRNCDVVSVKPVSLNYGNLILGKSNTQKIELTNLIDYRITAFPEIALYQYDEYGRQIPLDSEDFIVVPEKFILEKGETKNMYVTFNPQSFGNKIGSLDIRTRSSTAVVQIPLTGNCVTKPDLTGTIANDDYEIKSGRYLNSFFYAVNNIGGTASEESKVKYYLSLTSSLTTDPVFLGEQNIMPLQSGEKQYLPHNFINIPQETQTGNYYVIAVADSENEIDEHSETNNILAKRISVINSAPALTIDNIRLLDPHYTFQTLEEPGYLPGNPGKVAFSVRNFLDENVVFNTKIYLSKNTTYESSDIELASSNQYTAANSTSSIIEDFILPEETELGQWFLLFRAYEDWLPEDNGLIQVAHIGIQALRDPDYEIFWTSEYLLPVHPGEEIITDVFVRNNSNSSAPATKIKYYFSSDPYYDESDIELTSTTVPELTFNDPNRMIVHPITIPDGVVFGAWYVLFQADPDNLIEEENEANNWAYMALNVEPYPDLITSPLVLNVNSILSGSSIFVSSTVMNMGNGTAPESKLKFYLSANSTLDINPNDIELAEIQISELAYNEEFSINSFELQIPFEIGGGDWHIIAKADDERDNPTNWNWVDVNESNEDNNTASIQLSISRQPELFFRDIRLTKDNATITSIVEGSEIILSYEIQHSNGEMLTSNNPSGLSYAAQNTLRCYLSTDNIFDTNNDLLLNTHTVESSYGNTELNGDVTVTIPDEMIAASYHIYTVLDADNEIDERDETNNIWHQEFSINDKPDLILRDFQINPQVTIENLTTNVHISGLVENLAETSSSLQTYVAWYFSYDNVLDVDDIFMDNEYIGTTDLQNPLEYNIYPHFASGNWPENLGIGTYYLIFKTSCLKQESDESNNTTVVPLIISQTTDLNIAELSLDNTTIEEGTSFTVSCTIKNNNTTTSESCTLNFNLDTSPNSDSEFKHDLENIQVGSLAQGEELIINRTYTVPFGLTAHYFNAICDVDNQNLETDKENNKMSIGITVPVTPNLEVWIENIDPETIEAGDNLNIDCRFYNRSVSTAGEFMVKYYLSQNTQHNPSDLYLGEDIVNNLPGYVEININSSNIHIPETANIGNNYLLAVANPDNLLNERYTDNNTSSKIISIINPRPDLKISQPMLNVSSTKSGDIISVSCIIKNEGNGDVDAFDLNFYLSASTYYNFIPIHVFNEVNINSLNAGEEILINQEITIPEISRTNVYFSFFADKDNIINESNENNNAAFIPLIISEDYFLSSTVTDASCNGCSDGEIIITAHGGKEPYSYEWQKDGSIISSNKDLINQTAGNYQIQVTDANNESLIQSFSILQPDMSIVNSTITNVSLYGGSDGTIDLQLSGTPPYTFSWSNGATTEDIGGLTAAYYSVSITDAETSVYKGFYVTEPIHIEINLTNVSSYDGSDGEINCSIDGGYGSKTFLWYKDGEEYSTEQNLNNIWAGEYSLVVTDARGNNATANVSISQPNPLIANENITNVSIYGGNDGAIDLTISNGNPPYTFSWSDGSSIEDIYNLPAGNYWVDIRDSYHTVTKHFNITQPIDPNASISNVTQPGGSDGHISCNAQGGVGPYTYLWYQDGTEYASGYKINYLPAGQYEVHITDATGYITTNAYSITQPNPLEATFNSIEVSIYNGNDGVIEITINNGNPPYIINYFGPKISNSETWEIGKATGTISGLLSGKYYITITEENSGVNGNILDSEIMINNHIGFSNSSSTNVSQYGGSNGEIAIEVDGGVQPYLYSWTKDNVSYSTEESLANLTVGVYEVTITDLTGEILSKKFTISQPDELVVEYSVAEVSSAGGNDGAIDLNIISGYPPCTYEWTRNGSSTIISRDKNISGLVEGYYRVRVTDKLYQEFMSDNISMPEPVELKLSIRHVSTHGGSDGYLEALPLFVGQSYTYEWTLNGNYFSNQQSLWNIAVGEYTVIATNSWEKTLTETIQITEPDVWVIEHTVTDVSAYDGNDGAIDITVLGGNPPFTYTWYNTESTLEDVEGLVAGTYTVLVKDRYNSQLYKHNIEVANPLTITYLAKINNVTTSGNTGSIAIRCNGGYQPINMVWYKNGIEYSSHPNTNNGIISELSSGEYTVLFTDQENNTKTKTYYITDPVAVQMTTTMLSTHEANDAEASLNVFGGLPPYTFEWEKDNIAYSTEENLTNLSAGVYSVTVTDTEGRNASVTKEILAFSPSVVVSGGGQICGDGSQALIGIAFNGTAPYNIELHNGINTIALENITTNYYEYLTDIPGTYVVTSGNDNFSSFGSYSGTAIVELMNSPTATISGGGSTCSGDSEQTISFDLTGEAPWDISYTDGSLSYNVIGITTNHYEVQTSIPGTYTISSVNDANCTGSSSGTAEVIVADLPIAAITVESGICNDGETAILNIGLSGTAPWNLSYTDGTNSYDVNGITEPDYEISTTVTGLYSITQITDASGCPGLSINSVDLGINPLPTATVSGGATICENETLNLSFDLSGTAPWNITYTDGTISSEITSWTNQYLLDASTAGTYRVTSVSDANCVGSDFGNSTELIVNTLPNIDLGIDRIITEGETTTLDAGTGLSYLWEPDLSTGQFLNISTPGDYSVTVTNQNNCSNTDDISVSILNLGEDVSFCEGSFIRLDAGEEFNSYLWSDGSIERYLTVNTSGNYLVEVTNAQGYSKSDEIEVTVHPVPIINLGADMLINVGQSVTLDPGAGYTYIWNDGSTEQQKVVDQAGTYSVLASTINGCIAMDDITIIQLLSEPVLSFNNITRLSVDAQFDLVNGAEEYEIRYSESETTNYTFVTVAISPSTISGLIPGMAYDIQIRSLATGFTPTDWDQLITYSFTSLNQLPDPVISIGNITSGTADIEFEPIAGATSYQTSYNDIATGVYHVVTFDAPPFEMLGLDIGATYTVRVRTVEQGIESTSWGLAPRINFSTLSILSDPNISFNNISKNNLDVQFNTLTGATGYEIRYCINGTEDYTSISFTNPPYRMSNLLSNTVYNVQVRSIPDSSAPRDWAQVSVTSASTLEFLPDPVVSVENISSGTADIQLSEILYSSGYELRYAESGTNDYQFASITSISHQLTGLNMNTSYDIWVRTIDGNETRTSWENINQISFTTLDVLSNPELSFDNLTRLSAAIQFTLFNEAESYEIRYTVRGTTNYILVNTVSAPYTISGLSPNTGYDVQIRSLADGFSPTDWVQLAIYGFTTLSQLPDPVISIENISSDYAEIHFSPITGASSYQTSYNNIATGVYRVKTFISPPYQMLNLDTTATYTVRIRTVEDGVEPTSWSWAPRVNFVTLNTSTMKSTGEVINLENTERSFVDFKAFPNPVRNELNVVFTLKTSKRISIKVFDNAGNLVEQIVDEELSIGNYHYLWKSDTMSPGIYYIEFIDRKTKSAKKVMLIK